MTFKKILVTILCSIIGLIALFSFTTPDSNGLLYSTIALLLVYVLSASVVMLVTKLAYDKQATNKFVLFVSVVIGSIIPLMLVVSSLSKISALDIVLIVAIPLIIVWYVQKRRIF